MQDEDMLLKITDFTEQDAILLCRWVYEDKYAVYNCPCWEKVKEQNWGMADEEKRKSQFRKVIDQYGHYIGYFRFYTIDNKIMLGLGMNPQYCGKHIGPEFVGTMIEYIKKLYSNMPIELEVRSFNQRALKCYERCGFKITGKKYKETLIGNDDFIVIQYSN